jgi:hypothetical protein
MEDSESSLSAASLSTPLGALINSMRLAQNLLKHDEVTTFSHSIAA